MNRILSYSILLTHYYIQLLLENYIAFFLYMNLVFHYYKMSLMDIYFVLYIYFRMNRILLNNIHHLLCCMKQILRHYNYFYQSMYLDMLL